MTYKLFDWKIYFAALCSFLVILRPVFRSLLFCGPLFVPCYFVALCSFQIYFAALCSFQIYFAAVRFSWYECTVFNRETLYIVNGFVIAILCFREYIGFMNVCSKKLRIQSHRVIGVLNFYNQLINIILSREFNSKWLMVNLTMSHLGRSLRFFPNSSLDSKRSKRGFWSSNFWMQSVQLFTV